MTPHMVRYTVKPEQAVRNSKLVRDVIAELDRVQPAGLRYAAFTLPDGVTFIHLVWHDTDDEHAPRPRLDALKAFHAGIRERCDQAPVRTELTEIGSYRLSHRLLP